MTRARWLLAALAMILIAAVWYLLLWSPTSSEIETVQGETQAVEAQAAELRTRAAELRQVRAEAPEAAATLATADTLVPPEAALPPLLRQMQVAADESGVRLISISPGRPSAIEGGAGGLAAITVNVSAEGTYFQLVDLLRRVEDPTITGRGLVWQNANVTVGEEYPMLNLSLSATVYARMDAGAVAAAPEGAEEGAEGEDGAEGADGAEGDGAEEDDGAPDAGTTSQDTPAPAQPVDAGGEGEVQ